MKNHADILVVDIPPIMAVTDSMVLSTRVDGILLIIKTGKTKIEAAQQSISQLWVTVTAYITLSPGFGRGEIIYYQAL